MAVVSKGRFYYSDETGSRFDRGIPYAAIVGADCVFHMSFEKADLPKELLAYILDEGHRSRIRRNIHSSLIKNNASTIHIVGATFEECHKAMTSICQAFYQLRTETAKLIIYTLSDAWSCYENSDGTLAPCGIFGDRNGQWLGGGHVDATHTPNAYHIGIGARAVLRRTVKDVSGNVRKVSYEQIRPKDHLCSDEIQSDPALLLNSFIMRLPSEPSPDVYEIPYSDAAAQFFYQAIMALIKAGISIQRYLEDPETVKKIIAEGRLIEFKG